MRNFIIFLTAFYLQECHTVKNEVNLKRFGLPDINSLDMGEGKNFFNSKQGNQLFERMRDQCQTLHGQEAVTRAEQGRAEFTQCVLKYIRPNKLMVEIEKSSKKGNLDLVFKKYCGYKDGLLGCLDGLFESGNACLDSEQKTHYERARKYIKIALNRFIDFVCYGDGDRVMMFMGEGGPECLEKHKESIQKCAQNNMPQSLTEKIGETEDIKNNVNATFSKLMDEEDPIMAIFSGGVAYSNISSIFSLERCRAMYKIRDCVVEKVTDCEDSTPSNVIESLIRHTLKGTPCDDMEDRIYELPSAQKSSVVSSSSPSNATSGASSIPVASMSLLFWVPAGKLEQLSEMGRSFFTDNLGLKKYAILALFPAVNSIFLLTLSSLISAHLLL